MKADQPAEADAYACQRLQNALATDPRVSTLGLEVRLIGGGEVMVAGEVSTPAQQEAISRVVAEELPGHRLHNQVGVTPVADTASVEELS